MDYRIILMEALEQERRALPLYSWEERQDLNRRIRALKEAMMRPPQEVGQNARP